MFALGDTLYGTRKGKRFTGGRFTRNMVMIHDPSHNNCWTQNAGKNNAGYFTVRGKANAKNKWFWPGAPFAKGNTVVTPVTLMKRLNASGTGGFNFAQKKSFVNVSKVSRTTIRSVRTKKLALTRAQPGGTPISWGAGTHRAGRWTYLAGSVLRPGQYGHDIYLSRVRTSDLLSTKRSVAGNTAQYLTSTGFTKRAPAGSWRKVCDGACDSTVSMLSAGGRVHMVTKDHSILGSTISDYSSSSWAGSWSRKVVAHAPTKAGTNSYGATVHPNVARSGNLFTITLNYNTNDGTFDPARYRPAMFRIAL